MINKIKIILPSLFLGLFYILLRTVWHDFVVENIKLANILVFLLYAAIPLGIIFETVRRKRKSIGLSYIYTFYYSVFPGFVLSFDLSYGLFAVGHGYGFNNYLRYLIDDGFWMFIAFSLLSGSIGLFIDFVWEKLKPVN